MLKKTIIAGSLFFLCCGGVAQASSTSYTLGLDSDAIRSAGPYTTNLDWEEDGVSMSMSGTFRQFDSVNGDTGVRLFPGSLFVYLFNLEDLTNNPFKVEVDTVDVDNAVGKIFAEVYFGPTSNNPHADNSGDLKTLSFDITRPGAQWVHVWSSTATTDWVDEIRLTPVSAPVPVPGAVWLLGSGLATLLGLRRKSC